MEPTVETMAAIIVVATVVGIARYAKRIRKTFHIHDVVKFDDMRMSPRQAPGLYGRKSGSDSPRRKKGGGETEV